MPFRSFTTVIILLAFSLHTTTGTAMKKKSKNTDGVYDCFMAKLCKCKEYGKWADCWNSLEEVTQQFLIDRAQECDMTEKLRFAPFNDMVKQMCSFPEKEWKPCYEKINQELSDYVKVVNTEGSEEKQTEGQKIETGRVCLGPNMMECSTFGFDC